MSVWVSWKCRQRMAAGRPELHHCTVPQQRVFCEIRPGVDVLDWKTSVGNCSEAKKKKRGGGERSGLTGDVRSGMEAAIWWLFSFVFGADDPEDVWLNGVSVEDYVETARHKE